MSVIAITLCCARYNYGESIGGKMTNTDQRTLRIMRRIEIELKVILDEITVLDKHYGNIKSIYDNVRKEIMSIQED